MQTNRVGWGLLAPALAWIIAFFVLPIALMVAVSLWQRKGSQIIQTWDLGNYANFIEKSYFLQGLGSSPSWSPPAFAAWP